jgi:hypothetical protein
MGHAPSIAAKISSQIASSTTVPDISASRQQTRKSLFAPIIDALHHSRRLQAKRVLRQYQHLIDQTRQDPAGESDASSGGQHHVVE